MTSYRDPEITNDHVLDSSTWSFVIFDGLARYKLTRLTEVIRFVE